MSPRPRAWNLPKRGNVGHFLILDFIAAQAGHVGRAAVSVLGRDAKLALGPRLQYQLGRADGELRQAGLFQVVRIARRPRSSGAGLDNLRCRSLSACRRRAAPERWPSENQTFLGLKGIEPPGAQFACEILVILERLSAEQRKPKTTLTQDGAMTGAAGVATEPRQHWNGMTAELRIFCTDRVGSRCTDRKRNQHEPEAIPGATIGFQ